MKSLKFFIFFISCILFCYKTSNAASIYISAGGYVSNGGASIENYKLSSILLPSIEFDSQTFFSGFVGVGVKSEISQKNWFIAGDIDWLFGKYNVKYGGVSFGKIEDLGSIRLRFGKQLEEKLQLYGMVGVSLVSMPNRNLDSWQYGYNSNNEIGGLIGFGVDYKIENNFSLTAEYYYTRVNASNDFYLVGAGAYYWDIKLNYNTFKFGLRYHF